MTETGISHEETTLNAELARIGVNVSEENVRGVVSFAAELIGERADTPPGWRRRFHWLIAYAIAARIARRHGDRAAMSKHFEEVVDHKAWLLKRRVSEKELEKLLLGIADQMAGE